MNVTTKRYTSEQMEDMAKKMHYSGTDEFSDDAASMLAQASTETTRIAELTAELKNMIRGYVLLLETGRDMIISLGGSCDPVDVMEVGDHYLIKARNALKEGA